MSFEFKNPSICASITRVFLNGRFGAHHQRFNLWMRSIKVPLGREIIWRCLKNAQRAPCGDGCLENGSLMLISDLMFCSSHPWCPSQTNFAFFTSSSYTNNEVERFPFKRCVDVRRMCCCWGSCCLWFTTTPTVSTKGSSWSMGRPRNWLSFHPLCPVPRMKNVYSCFLLIHIAMTSCIHVPAMFVFVYEISENLFIISSAGCRKPCVGALFVFRPSSE